MTPEVPTQQTVAALDWEAATVEDLWRASDLARVPARTIFATVEKLGRRES